MNNSTPLTAMRIDLDTRKDLKVLSAQERKTMGQMIKTLVEFYKKNKGE
jgi:predicted DNA-binding protein